MRHFIRERTRIFWIVLGFLLIAVIGSIDAQFQSEVIFYTTYLLPIFILAWFVGRDIALAGAVVSAMMWSAADIYVKTAYSSPVIFYWNNFIILVTFLFAAYLISDLRLRISNVSELRAIDPLTGALKLNAFLQAISEEIERLKRINQPFTLAYLDLDGLEKVNSQAGFSAGDQVLRSTADTLKQRLRKTDLTARLAGDEFAILLPETGQEAAREVISRIRNHLLNDLPANAGKLTFSIGVLTCQSAPSSPEDLVKTALDAMLFVKKNGKDGVCFSTYPPT